MGCYVYFISDGHGHIKIGKALDVTKRIKELQVGNPYPLQYILSIHMQSEELAFGLEAALHRHFKNVQMEGEWFIGAPVMQLIDTEIVRVENYSFGGLKYSKR